MSQKRTTDFGLYGNSTRNLKARSDATNVQGPSPWTTMADAQMGMRIDECTKNVDTKLGVFTFPFEHLGHFLLDLKICFYDDGGANTPPYGHFLVMLDQHTLCGGDFTSVFALKDRGFKWVSKDPTDKVYYFRPNFNSVCDASEPIWVGNNQKLTITVSITKASAKLKTAK